MERNVPLKLYVKKVLIPRDNRGKFIKQLRRGAGDCSARVLILSFPSLSRARKILRALPRKFFRRNSLTKQSVGSPHGFLRGVPYWGGGGTCDVHLFGASSSTMSPFSKTVSRAAHPNLHSGRLRPLLQVAARFATSQARRNIK